MHFMGVVVLPGRPTSREHLEEMLTTLLHPFDESAEEFFEKRTESWTTDDGEEVTDTYGANPNGEFDYWRLGGRWGGFFDVVDLGAGFVGDRSWDSPDEIKGLDCTSKGNVISLPTPFTWIAEGVWKQRIAFHDYPRSAIDKDEWAVWSARFWAALPGEAWVAAIDYHS